MILEFSINTYKQYRYYIRWALQPISLLNLVLLNYPCSFTGSFLSLSAYTWTTSILCHHLSRTCLREPPTRQLIPSCSCAIGVIFLIGYEPRLKMVRHTLTPMPVIFTRYGSWMVTGLTLAISMVIAAMTIAFAAEPFRVTGEDKLLEFAVPSGELIIRRLLRGFRLLYVIAVQLCFTLNHFLKSTVHPIHLSQKNETHLHSILLLSWIATRTLSFLDTRSNFVVLYALISWRLERSVFIQTEV